jgi:hypothetical protein
MLPIMLKWKPRGVYTVGSVTDIWMQVQEVAIEVCRYLSLSTGVNTRITGVRESVHREPQSYAREQES